ncbi:hypothetical protein Tco_0998183 [Tanacetum coccineum]
MVVSFAHQAYSSNTRVIESYKWYQSSGSRVLWLTRIDQEEVFVVHFFWKEQDRSILFGLPGSRQQKFLVLRFFDVKEQQGIDRVKRHGGSKQVGLKQLGSKQVGFKQLGHKQVGFKQLGPGVETGVHGVQDEKRVWFEVELQGAQGDREAEVFQVSNDDAAVAQRRLEDKQLEEKTNTDCLVKEQEKVHLGIKVGANITVTGVPGQEGAEGNVAEKKKVKESMKANLGKLLKYNAWSTRWSPVRGSSMRKRC